MSFSLKTGLSDLLDKLYGSIAEPEGLAGFLPDLCKAFDDARGLLHIFDAETLTTPRFYSAGMSHEAETAYSQHFVALNPYPLAAFEKSDVGTVIRSIDVVPARDAAKSEFVADWMAPQKIGVHHFGTMVQRDDAGMALIAICPPEARTREYLDCYVEAFRELTPHIRRAIELHRHVQPLQARAALGHSLLEILDVAAVLLDHQGRCLDLNSSARALIEKSKVAVLSATSPFRLSTSQDDARLKAAIEASRGASSLGPPSAPACFRLETSCFPLVVWAISLRRQPTLDNHSVSGLLGPPPAAETLLLFVRPDQTRGAPSGPQSLRIIYGLTPAESEVAARIASGLSLEMVAEDLEISKTTARNQLASVMSKMGLNRQAELVACVSALSPAVKIGN